MPLSKKTFSDQLLTWYHANARDLPWRRTRDPYKIWISEIMLQQTTVAAVIPYYERWVKRFPTVESLARARLQSVLNMWQGLGYYTRAKNLHAAAKQITAHHAGRLPDAPDDLLRLPGFGRYTVGAVLSIAFDKEITLIDANVRRVVMRLLSIEDEAVPKHDAVIDAYLQERLPRAEMGFFNQSLMELGALICRKKMPLCNMCPVQTHCAAYRKGIQERIPTPKQKILTDLHVAIGIMQDDGRYYIQKRPSKGLLGDLWEFPGGKIEEGESAKAALIRELKEETGAVIRSARNLFRVKHYYTSFRVHLTVFAAEFDMPPITDALHRWVAPGELSRYPMPSGSARIVERLLENPA